jgi:hypothetical protein
MDFWELPGPVDFLNRVQEDLRAGKNVLLSQPRATVNGMTDALYSRLGREGWMVSSHTTDAAASPMTTIMAALGFEDRAFEVTSCVSLCRQPECQEGRVVIIERVDGADREEWRNFMAQYERACREVSEDRRTLVILVLSEAPLEAFAKRDVALGHRIFDGAVTELDMLLYASMRLIGREENPRRRALLASSVSRVAMWDVVLADRLLDGALEQMLEPAEVLRDYAASMGWEECGTATWREGTIASWAGGREAHSAWLAVKGEEAEIERRLWGAQASMFLPEIERQRLQVIPEASRFIGGPFETALGRVREVADLEIGALDYFLQRSNAPTTLKSKVRILRDTRNDLAHLRRLPASEALYGSLI